jgi:hypothetical protein
VASLLAPAGARALSLPRARGSGWRLSLPRARGSRWRLSLPRPGLEHSPCPGLEAPGGVSPCPGLEAPGGVSPCPGFRVTVASLPPGRRCRLLAPGLRVGPGWVSQAEGSEWHEFSRTSSEIDGYIQHRDRPRPVAVLMSPDRTRIFWFYRGGASKLQLYFFSKCISRRNRI